MGKEVKIGLAAIFSLLIVLGAVLANRLMGSSDASQPAAAKETTPASDSAPARTKPPATKQTKPTVVAAKPVSGKSPKSPAGQWTVVADPGGEAQQPGEAVAPAPLPPYMPNPTGPTSSSYHGPYANPAQQSTPAQPWQQSAPNLPTSQGAAGVSDLFQNRSTQTPSAGGPVDEGARGLKILSPPPLPAAGDGYGYSPPPQPITPVGQYAGSSRHHVSVYGGGTTPAQNLRREDGAYKVQPGDSYWIVSQKLYGTGAYFKALAEHNRGKVPRESELAVGQRISAPEVTELEELYPALCPKPSRRETIKQRATTVSARMPYGGGRTYVVEEGDTLFDIARYELGKASRWVEIYELNRHVLGEDFDYLTPGLQLTLPSDQPAARITTRPDVGGGFHYRR